MSENLNPIVLEVEEVRVVNAVSPTVDLSRTENGALVSIHDYRGTQTVEILDGPVGPVGPQGHQGESGAETAKAIVEEAISRMEDSIHDAQMIGQTVAGYRDAAAQSASNAALSKDAAALSAQAAEQSNQSSSGYARTAGEQAENAAQSAQASSQSATAADTSASNAAQSATNAGNSASAASQSAQAASQSATNAAQSERNAADSAQDAQDVLDSIPADYSTLSSDVTSLKSAVNQRPIAVKTFVVPAGQSHSSTKDRLLVDIKAGEKYIIVWGNANQAFVNYSDGTSFSRTSSPIEGTAEKDISSIGLYRGAPSEDVTAYIIAYYNPVGYDMYKTLGEVGEHDKYLERLKHVSVGKNLVDNVPNTYFPVYIKAGEKVTWSCQDGEPIVSSTFYVYFYDKDKTQVSYYGSASTDGKVSRTVTPSATTDIYYIRLTIIGSYQWRPLQIEIGDTATDYEAYIPNNLFINDEIKNNDRYLSKSVSFALNSGTSHSSAYDKLKFNIDAGETYGVFVKSSASRSVELYEYNGTTNASKGNILTNTFYLKTSTSGATDLSLFVSSGSKDADFSLIAYRINSIDGVLSSYLSDIPLIDLDSRTVEFTVNANVAHSSLNNQIVLSVNEGEYFYAVATQSSERDNNAIYVRNNSEEVSLGAIGNGVIKRFKAPFNITSFGFYMSSGSEKTTVRFTVFTEKSILAKLTEKTEYDNLYLTKLLNAKRKANPGNYNNQTSPEIFTLAHFSDIHGNSWAMKQVQEFKDAYQTQLDDVICTGDVVSDKIADGTAFWDGNSDGKILICIGNHDSLGSNGWANPVDQQTLYETYIAPYEANWGAEIVNGHSYWYKDYSDKKIRLIAVDATIYDSTEQANQMTWLNTALSGAITNGYAVVGAVHFPPMPANFHKIDGNFTALLHGTAGDMSQFAWHTYHTEILTAVDQFITNGGDFVCWLSGHTHYDLVSYDDRFPKQLFITISCAMPSSLFEEKVRDSKRESGLVLNTVCVDTVRKYVKLLRYGAEWDDCLRHTGTCVIKYDANPPTVMFSN